MMLLVAFKGLATSAVQFRTNGSVFNLRRLQARTSEFSVILRDLLYADEYVLLRSCFSQTDPKSILNLFQVNPKIQFTRAQLYRKYPALKQHTILNTDTLQRENTKIVRKSMCLYDGVQTTPTCQSSQVT